MALTLSGKKQIVADLNGKFNEAMLAIVIDYRGLTVAEMTLLRKQARVEQVYLVVVRNTLARRAVAGTNFEELSEQFIGPTLLVLAPGEPGVVAKIISEFIKEREKVTVRALSLGGKVYEPKELEVLAKLPTKEQSLSMLMQVMRAPVANLMQCLNQIPSKLVRVLAAVRDQKQSQ